MSKRTFTKEQKPFVKKNLLQELLSHRALISSSAKSSAIYQPVSSLWAGKILGACAKPL